MLLGENLQKIVARQPYCSFISFQIISTYFFRLLSYIIPSPKRKCHLCPYCCSHTARSCVRHILVGGCSNLRTTAIEVLTLYNVLAQYRESGSNCSNVQGEGNTHTQQDDTRRFLFNFQERMWTTNMFYPAPEFECHLR